MSAEEAVKVELVIDASIGVKWFVPEIQSDRALSLLGSNFRRHVPSLFFTEVAQTLWKKVYQRREISEDEGREAVRSLLVMPIAVHPTGPHLEAAFEIANETGRTVYDSTYVALAVALGCRFVTADLRLFNALQDGPFAPSVILLDQLQVSSDN